MAALLEKKVVLTQSKALAPWQIQSQLAEIGIPYIPISWNDEFLMAENLQNYFAEVLAGYSLLELREEEKDVVDIEKLKRWEAVSLKVIQEKNKYHLYDLAKTQKLLLWLMKEAKNIEKLRQYDL